MSTKNLFSDFNPVSAKAWKQKIQMDLKGADYNKTLLTNTLEGITIQPFYHHDTYNSLEIPKQNNKSKICQTIFIDDEKIVNGIAKETIQKGAESIRFIANFPFKIKAVFKDLPKNIDYIVNCNFYEEKFLKKLVSFATEKNITIVVDIINHFSSDGNWFETEKKDFDILLNNAITIGIDSSLYQNAGANIIQQIAYSLAHVNEYLNARIQNTEDRRPKTNDQRRKFLPFGKTEDGKDYIFTFAIGSNYFFEISKIRAFKYLIRKLFAEYQIENKVKILLQPTLRNKTLYDYNVNLLRTTTENMAAMLSGADYISNIAYDSIYHRSNEFGSRIARNQLLILKEESYFSQDFDINKGSYYIEQITYEIANKALTLFKDIEKNGGFLAQLKKGTIQRKIEESASQEQLLFDNGELILLGTNKYPNPNDKMKNELELYPFVKTNPRKTQIKPIIPRRLSEKIEQERLKTED